MMSPSNDQLMAVRQRWDLDVDIQFLSKSESFVYAAMAQGRAVILRMTEPSHRSVEDLESELDWIGFLSRSGMRIAAPVRSSNGELVHAIVGAKTFHACVFERAVGNPLIEGDGFRPDVLEKWGNYIGTMHRLTQRYQPEGRVKPRAIWNADTGFQVTRQGLDGKRSAALCEISPVDGMAGVIGQEFR